MFYFHSHFCLYAIVRHFNLAIYPLIETVQNRGGLSPRHSDKAKTAVCVVDAAGVVWQDKCASTPEAILAMKE